MRERHTLFYKTLVLAALLSLGSGCIRASSETSEYIALNLDNYGRIDRSDFLQTIDPLIGSLVFIKGRIRVNEIVYPEASHFHEDADGAVYPCTENPFDVPLHEYPTRERTQAGLVPVPWFFNAKFVGYGTELVRSMDMEIAYGSRDPVESFELADIHDKCVTILAEVSGKRDITSVFVVGTLFIHNIYDTEDSLSRK